MEKLEVKMFREIATEFDNVDARSDSTKLKVLIENIDYENTHQIHKSELELELCDIALI